MEYLPNFEYLHLTLVIHNGLLEKYSLTASCMLLKPGVGSMKGALLSTLLSLWQSSHLVKSQIHISQIITTYNVIVTCNCIPTKHSKN